jgi:polysaccharide deacetylase family protein (PEP-CTERM system associated)
MTSANRPESRHLLTVGLEDYYQVGAFNRLIQRGQWYRFETRIAHSTARTLELLDELGVRATFFVLGWVADQLPEVVRTVSEHGHEIASKGYYHRSIRQMTPAEFREDLARAREALQRASGQKVLGYRVADDWFGPDDLWALDVLAAEGYDYDSSVGPILRRFAAEPWRRFAHLHQFGDRTLWEFPISAMDLFGIMIPVAGGNWFRQFPPSLMKRAVARWHRTYRAPFVMYFHTWELDPEQPRITAATWLQHVRHYRNLHRVPDFLRYYLTRYRFTPVADYLGVSTGVPRREAPAPPAPVVRLGAPDPGLARSGTDTVPVTIVVPCYNEELILPYLANTLQSVERALADRYRLHLVLVDDASGDGTWSSLQRLFGDRPDCTLVRQERNRGVARTILEGIRRAPTEIVCSIDCDCTYDPHELGRMIPLLTEEVDLVTASPYHPSGAVRNVPRWRLALSRAASALYRLVLGAQLHTWTACFRVYRRSAMLGRTLRSSGYLGVPELAGQLILEGRTVVEYPATLEVRVLGRSKMKVARTILGHLRLLGRFAWLRLRRPAGRRPPGPPDSPPASVEASVARRAG